MFNLQDLMQRYHPQFGQFMQGQPGMGQFGQQPQGMPGYSQQSPGGYQSATSIYAQPASAAPAMAPMPQGGQGWGGGYSAGPAMRPQGPMQRYSLGSLMGRQNY